MASLPGYTNAKWRGNKKLAKSNYTNLKESVLNAPGAAQRTASGMKGQYEAGSKWAGIPYSPATAAASKPFQQTVNILTGKIDPSQIVKYLFLLSIILIAGMLLIGFVRGILVSIDMVGCGIGKTGCSLTSWIPLVGQECNDCSAVNMQSYYFMWDIEWIIRCFIYICFALIVLTILYVWANWLFDKLLRFNMYVKKFDNWIYNFEWEGKAEK